MKIQGLYKVLLFCIIAVTVFLFAAGCGKKKVITRDPERLFNKQELLANIADNVILKSYSEFKSSIDNLKSNHEKFILSGSVEDFQVLKTDYLLCYQKYQHISLFGFGPGEDFAIRNNFNVFPTDTVKIKKNIEIGHYNLDIAANLTAKGLPALDYLLFGYQDQKSTELLRTDIARRNYVSDLLNDLSLKINGVIHSWNNSYRNTFVNSLGTDVGSSIGFLINQVNFELDYLKNAKIATPLGLRSDGIPLPDNSEAFYCGRSVEYAIETLSSLENVYRGRDNNGIDGLGFDDYVSHLNLKYCADPLADVISNQFAATRTTLFALKQPLSKEVIDNRAGVDAAYKQLVKLLVLLKTDLPSGLGVVITYQDGDGD